MNGKIDSADSVEVSVADNAPATERAAYPETHEAPDNWRELAAAVLPSWLDYAATLAWIYCRDATVASKVARTVVNKGGSAIRLAMGASDPKTHTYSENSADAENALRVACISGKVRCLGVTSNGSRHERKPMTVVDWQDLKFLEDRHKRPVARPEPDGAGREWRSLLFDRDEILNEWPPYKVVVPANATPQDPPKMSRLGRPHITDWKIAEEALHKECADQGGTPSSDIGKGWRTQADAVRFVLKFLSDKGEDAEEKTVRGRIAPMLRRYTLKAGN